MPVSHYTALSNADPRVPTSFNAATAQGYDGANDIIKRCDVTVNRAQFEVLNLLVV